MCNTKHLHFVYHKNDLRVSQIGNMQNKRKTMVIIKKLIKYGTLYYYSK